LVTVLKEGYGKSLFWGDLTAGIITGIVALPLAIAFAIAAGVEPIRGFNTAIVAGLIISLLSGSRVQIGGPTGAFVVLISSVIGRYGLEGLAVATLTAGVLLIIMGAMRLGSFIKYIPYPVTLGFTAGIAVIIAAAQIKPLLGLDIESLPAHFLPKIITCVKELHTSHLQTASISILAAAVIYFWPKALSKLPGSLAAIILTTVLVKLLAVDTPTIGTEFGVMKGSLPAFTPVHITPQIITDIFPAALSIAMLGAIESLLSAVVADGMTGSRHRSNMELIAQGAANIACPYFGGIPATGAIARTATNIKNGGKTPFAGIIHCLTLLLILVCFGPLASAIPLCTLAVILISVAVKMSEYQMFIKMFKAPKSDIAVMAATFLLTVFLDLTVAIPTGMVMASFLFMSRMEQVSGTKMISSDNDEDPQQSQDIYALSRYNVPQGVEVFEISGPFFFGAASKFQDEIISNNAEILILRMRNVPAIDATGLFALEKIILQARHGGRSVLISGINSQPFAAMKRSGLLRKLSPECMHENISSALEHARILLSLKEENPTDQ
jgi:SulP family sulfate permease